MLQSQTLPDPCALPTKLVGVFDYSRRLTDSQPGPPCKVGERHTNRPQWEKLHCTNGKRMLEPVWISRQVSTRSKHHLDIEFVRDSLRSKIGGEDSVSIWGSVLLVVAKSRLF